MAKKTKKPKDETQSGRDVALVIPPAGTDVGADVDATPIDIAAETMLGDLTQTMRQELHAMPAAWSSLSEDQQGAILTRVAQRCRAAIAEVVRIVATQNRPSMNALVDSVTFKDGIRVVLKLPPGAPDRYSLADASGQQVLILVTHAENLMGGESEAIKPDPVQRSLHLDESANAGSGEPKKKTTAGGRDNAELALRLRAALCGDIPVDELAQWKLKDYREALTWADAFVSALNGGTPQENAPAIPAWLAAIVEAYARGDEQSTAAIASAAGNSFFGVRDADEPDETALGVWAQDAEKAAEIYREKTMTGSDVQVAVRKLDAGERFKLGELNYQGRPPGLAPASDGPTVDPVP